jgi:metal-responsive CopG/Arc/MetJ family transcriptional regulator
MARIDRTGMQLVAVPMEPDLIKRIDDFRFKQRFTSRAEAIRWLIEHALAQRPKREESAEK